jgi:hypothetical protein
LFNAPREQQMQGEIIAAGAIFGLFWAGNTVSKNGNLSVAVLTLCAAEILFCVAVAMILAWVLRPDKTQDEETTDSPLSSPQE